MGYWTQGVILLCANLRWLTNQDIFLRSMLLAVSLLLHNLYALNTWNSFFKIEMEGMEDERKAFSNVTKNVFWEFLSKFFVGSIIKALLLFPFLKVSFYILWLQSTKLLFNPTTPTHNPVLCKEFLKVNYRLDNQTSDKVYSVNKVI